MLVFGFAEVKHLFKIYITPDPHQRPYKIDLWLYPVVSTDIGFRPFNKRDEGCETADALNKTYFIAQKRNVAFLINV